MISTVISYCSNDYRFIKRCIDSVKPFSRKVIVTISSHYFNGDPENMEIIQKTVNENYDSKQVIFMQYNYDASKNMSSRYWHNYGRYVAVDWLSNNGDQDDHLLFLDSDEIVDTDMFVKWLLSKRYEKHDAFWFGCYWYFRDEKYRATTQENAGLFITKSSISNIFNENERLGMLVKTRNGIQGEKSVDGLPMIHHYSWVRNKEEMLQKVRSWGHNGDRDWASLVEEEFTHEFNGNDFVHQYQYEILNK